MHGEIVMAKIKVKYLAKVTEIIEWPDDEMPDFNYSNLHFNLNPETNACHIETDDIIDVHVNGERHEF